MLYFYLFLVTVAIFGIGQQVVSADGLWEPVEEADEESDAIMTKRNGDGVKKSETALRFGKRARSSDSVLRFGRGGGRYVKPSVVFGRVSRDKAPTLLRFGRARAAHDTLLRFGRAFNTYTGMPFGTVNLKWGLHRSETPITCVAGIGTYLLEFGALSRLTGSPHLERVAMKALMELWKHRSAIGLVGNHMGAWTATDAGIGAGVDSYFEYLVKGAVMFEKPELMRQFREYQQAINTYVKQEDWFVWVTMTKGQVTSPIFQSLEAFWPGLLTLVGDVQRFQHVPKVEVRESKPTLRCIKKSIRALPE